MAERVISKAISPQPAPAAKSGAGKGADAKADADEGEDASEAEEAASEAENGSEDADLEDEGGEPEELDENEAVSGVSAEDLAAGQTKARRVRKAPKVPQIPDGHIAVLTSPRDFGIWIAGKLHRFKKGRTPLTEEQHDAAHLDEYVRDNGASVSYRPKGK